MEKRILIASWLFLIGSSLFLIDSMFEVVQHFSPLSLLHLSEGILFLLGSIFFMPSSSNSSPSLPKTECNGYSETQGKPALVATDYADEQTAHEPQDLEIADWETEGQVALDQLLVLSENRVNG